MSARSWKEMFQTTEFSLPENSEVLKKRLETNGLYYLLNYIFVTFICVILGSFCDRSGLSISLLIICLHISLRKRTMKSKWNLYMERQKSG